MVALQEPKTDGNDRECLGHADLEPASDTVDQVAKVLHLRTVLVRLLEVARHAAVAVDCPELALKVACEAGEVSKSVLSSKKNLDEVVDVDTPEVA